MDTGMSLRRQSFDDVSEDVGDGKRGPVRKVLSAVPDMDTQSTKMIGKTATLTKPSRSYASFFLEYTLLAEYHLLQKQKIPGVYMVPSAKSHLLWFGVLFVRRGVYEEAIFRFHLHIPENFPEGDCPKVVFTQPMFHPMIDPSGVLDVTRLFGKWNKDAHHIWQVVAYARKAFYKIDTTMPVNSQAALLLDTDKHFFQYKVSECVKASKENVYKPPESDDPHEISFSKYDPQTHDKAVTAMRNPKREEPVGGNLSSKGLSWVQPGTFDVFSKPMQ